MGSHPLFIERRRNLQNNSRSGPESSMSWLLADRPVDWPKCAFDCPIDCAKSYKTPGLTGNVGRLAGRPTNWISLLSINFSRPIQALWMSVDCPVDRSPVIELKNSISYFYPLFLHSPPRWRFFKSEPNSNEDLTKSTHNLNEINTQSRLERSWKNRHKNSAKWHTISTWSDGPIGSKMNRQHTYKWFQMITPHPNWVYRPLNNSLQTLISIIKILKFS